MNKKNVDNFGTRPAPSFNKNSFQGRDNPSEKSMKSILSGCGIHLDDKQARLLWQYHQLLRKFNPDINLTRIHNFSNMVQKLYADSIMPSNFMMLPTPLIDLGTGPGMPGIPLKIVSPDVHIILSESRGKRNDFLRTVISELGLDGIEVLGAGMYPESRIQVNGVITRAVEDIPETLDRISGSLARDGLAIFMKGPECEDEIAKTLRNFKKDYVLEQDTPYVIKGTAHERRLVVFRRVSSPVWQVNIERASELKIKQIESDRNDIFRDLLKLLGGRGIKKAGKTIVSGSKQVFDVLESMPEICEAWITKNDTPPPPDSSPDGMYWFQLAPKLYEELDVFGTKTPLLLVRTPEIEEWNQDAADMGCTLFVPFQDPENVGAVIRSAAAFGVSAVVMLEGSANPYHPKAVRSSGAAVFHVKIYNGPLMENLDADSASGMPIMSLSAEGEDISGYTFPERFGLLAGVEGQGLSDKWRANALSIPINPAVESLNAATSASIALYLWASSTGKK
ncbi:16S rRNA (guanine(527)-N(7))-methyltransferase RsmG [Desulforegula conservatrix]|uniref:16S rRNA (guanine(527)-N(7))-methyltransferase RsmG n=1 Tax=Desulforegula conservatrix TaxID=153026 RepID=UPI000412E658|nr:16S rRNA (guanine(527)-N(7))-methyltransferase RsmG [Desulforegula conservatrix]